MYYFVDRNGCVRGQTSDKCFVEPLKNALEYIFRCEISVFIKDSRDKD